MTDNSMKSIYQKRTRIGDNILKVLIYLAAGVAIALLVGIMGYVFVRGLPQVSWQLLSTVQSSLKGTFGILGNIINTIYIIVITLIIAAPIGIGSAIYLNEYAKPGKLVRTIEFTTEILSGIPSIIFGLFGMVFFGMTLKLGYSVLTGSFTLTLMVLPLITRNTQEALKTVPDSYRPLPDDRDRGGNVLFRGTSPGSALYHRSGAVRIYHVYQHGAQPDVCEGGRRK